MSNDRRRGNSDKFPVVRVEIGTITIAAAGAAEVTTTYALNGIIGTLCAEIIDTTNGVTATLAVRDEDEFVLYTVAALTDNTLHVKTDVDILCAGPITFGVTPSGVPGVSTMTVAIVAYLV